MIRLQFVTLKRLETLRALGRRVQTHGILHLTCAKPASAACSSPACIRASPTSCRPGSAFYENWLNAEGLREGTIGLAPLYAVLSFLRQEGDAYS